MKDLATLKREWEQAITDGKEFLATHRGPLPIKLRNRLVKARLLYEEADKKAKDGQDT